CAQEGHVRTALSEKKFGTANRHAMSAVIRIPAAFHRVKNNIDSIVLVTVVPRRPYDQLALSSFTGSPLARTSDTIERICRTRTPSEISTSIWSSSTTLVTLPTSPPLVTTVSPRRSALTIC